MLIGPPIDIRWKRRKLPSTIDVETIPRFILKKVMKIMDGGLEGPRVQALLAHHFSTAHSVSPPGSAHALDLCGLRQPDVNFWSGWDGERVITIGALKRLSGSEGEIKSMHTGESYRRTGAGSMMLQHIIARAREIGLSRLSLETGSQPYFGPAREFYKRHGFVECPAFGSYVPDENSVFMTLALDPIPHARPICWI